MSSPSLRGTDGRNRRDAFLLEADLHPFAIRMTEAGYDVLLNKLDWRNKSTERRDVWKPAVGSLDRSGGLFLTQGMAADLQFQLRDPFGSYPLLLAGGYECLLPRGLWLTPQEDQYYLLPCGGG